MLAEEILKDYDVILASGSPRRRELMGLICSDFTVEPSGCEEVLPEEMGSNQGAVYLSMLKCEDVGKKHENSLVIGCDTLVSCQNKIMGKPKDEKDAFEMLSTLSGKTHQVVTGVTMGYQGNYTSFCQTTNVTFREISSKEINAYIATKEPFDKAGAYAAQGYGALLIKGIEGDFFNVVGLPVCMLSVKLIEFLNF